jgi:hypothetical protein
MLERKRQFKEIEVRKSEDGSLLRIYQHGKSGEVFVIPDPGLKLSQVATVQEEVAHLLSAAPTATPQETTPSQQVESAQESAPPSPCPETPLGEPSVEPAEAVGAADAKTAAESTPLATEENRPTA